MLRKVIVLLLVTASGHGMAAVSVCSAEFLPEDDGMAIRHDVLWDYYDNWSADLQVLITTRVDGPLPLDEATMYEMGAGGHVVHYMPKPPAGSYEVQGAIQLGHTGAIGFDPYQIHECLTWQGDISEDHARIKQSSANSSPDASNCLTDVGDCSSTNRSLSSIADDRGKKELADREAGTPGLVIISGLVQAVDASGLVLRTDVGRYVTLTLPAGVRVTKRADFTLGEVKLLPGDQVGIQVASGRQIMRIYRNESWAEAESSKLISGEVPEGVEKRGVLQQSVRANGQHVLNLQTGRPEPLQRAVADDSVVSVIEAADTKALLPFIGAARVLAEQSKDGTLVARSIEIL